MKIYEFTTWTFRGDGLFTVNEIEVEEKPKSYIGKNCRILKDDIDKLNSRYGNRMYRLENNPKPYIDAMIEKYKHRVKRLEESLLSKKAKLEEWENLKGV